jgi:class 3 adenylate cyclase
MEPRIQYVTTPDGVNLAFCTEGSGTPIVYMPTFTLLGHLQVDGLTRTTQAMLAYLTPRGTVVRYDRRGQGLSDRDAADVSLDAHVSDLLTILDRLSIERVALFGRIYGGPVAIAFAARYPERVSQLILSVTTASLPEVYAHSERLQAFDALLDKDWALYTDVVSRLFVGWQDHELGTRLAAQARLGNTPDVLRRFRDIQRTWDVSALLSAITAPTLVLHVPAALIFTDDRWSRALAAGIPGAQLRILDRAELDQQARAAYAFISGEKVSLEPAAAPLPTGTAVILFADIVDSTALTEQLGDAAFRARATRLDGSMWSAIHQTGGTPIDGKVMGDGVMAVFATARQAIDGAFGCQAAADGTGLALYLGIHAGDVISEKENVYGGAVNIASRISALSAPGEVLVSDIVRGLARTSAGVAFEDRGEHALKGLADAVRVFAVRPKG